MGNFDEVAALGRMSQYAWKITEEDKNDIANKAAIKLYDQLAPKLDRLIDLLADTAPKEKQWLTAGDVCKMLGISIRSLYRKISEGKFPAGCAIAEGRPRRWKWTEVERAIEESGRI